MNIQTETLRARSIQCWGLDLWAKGGGMVHDLFGDPLFSCDMGHPREGGGPEGEPPVLPNTLPPFFLGGRRRGRGGGCRFLLFPRGGAILLAELEGCRFADTKRTLL